MVIDTHAHLNDLRLKDFAGEIAGSMAANNLSAIINVGFDCQSSVMAFEQAKSYGRVYAAVGIHPHDAKNASDKDFDHIEKMSSHAKVVAIGECGLDYYYTHSEKDVQRKIFIRQLELADHAGLPVVLHCRDAYDDMKSILQDCASLLNSGGVLHCYAGSVEMSKIFMKMDLHFSFGGVLTFKNAEKAREVLLSLPKDRFFLETDCPYLTPEPYRGQLNYPQYVNFVAAKAAEILRMPLEEVEAVTTANAKAVFTKLQL